MRGPIDYIVVGFDGPKFDGSVLAALADAIDKGTIALIALSAIKKDAQGVITVADVADFGDEFVIQFAQKYKVTSDLVTDEDKQEVGDLLENDTAAGLLVIEQLWAKPLKKSIT